MSQWRHHYVVSCKYWWDILQFFQSHKLSGWFVPKIMKSCLHLSKLRPKYCRSLFFRTRCITVCICQNSKQLMRQETYLYLSNLRRQHQSFVISMHHNYNANGSRRDPPRVLICVADLPCFWILKRDVKHLRKVLAKVVRCCCLLRMHNTTTSMKTNQTTQCNCILYFKKNF